MRTMARMSRHSPKQKHQPRYQSGLLVDHYQQSREHIDLSILKTAWGWRRFIDLFFSQGIQAMEENISVRRFAGYNAFHRFNHMPSSVCLFHCFIKRYAPIYDLSGIIDNLLFFCNELVHLSVFLFVHLCVFLFVHLSICLSVILFVHSLL